MVFSPDFLTYPTKQQYVQYLESCVARFELGRFWAGSRGRVVRRGSAVMEGVDDGGGECEGEEDKVLWQLVVSTGENAKASQKL